MRPTGPPMWIPGVDSAPDQVPRRLKFVKRHPEIAITSPRENGTQTWQALWTSSQPPKDATEDGVVELVKHEELRFLLDYLEARFDRGSGA